jgi:5'-nucleotidase
MLILLTNDDGIAAPGLVALYRKLTQLGDVHVVAPESVQSAAGHGITIRTPLLASRLTVDDVFTGFAVDGRPADCVKLAINQLLPARPDLVVSGINSGANVGINVIYSGTVAAAIEAAFLGIPSIAFSLYLRDEIPTDYDRAAGLSVQLIRDILEAGLTQHQCASVNLPALRPGEPPAGVKIVRQCTRPWSDTYEKQRNSTGQDQFVNRTVFTLSTPETDTDVAALRDRYITITPLEFDLTDHRILRKWSEKTWAL